MDEFIWLAHPETGGRFRCPVAAEAAWKARGWVDGEPPPEPDTTKDPEARIAYIPQIGNGIAATAADIATAIAEAESTPKPTARTTRRTTAAATEEKE